MTTVVTIANNTMGAIKKILYRKSVKLISFVSLSLLAHGLLFLVQTDQQQNTTQISLGNSRLNVSLSIADSEIKNPASTTKQDSSQNLSLQKINQTAQIKETHQTIIPEPQATPATTQKTTQKKSLRTAQHNFLLGEIQHRLSRHLSYPIRAQRRGWQGEVMVGFQVDKKGFLHNVHLTKTSGYSLLDNAAVSAIEKVKSIPLFLWFEHSQENIFHPTALQLPVKYRLTNS